MSASDLNIFSMMLGRLTWLGQRQTVLEQNVSNADTPGYKPFEIEPFSFEKVMSKQNNTVSGQLQPVSTDPAHIGLTQGAADSQPFSVSAERNPYEVFMNGNGVDLEEQMTKTSENASNYQMMTELYAQTVSLFKTAIKAPS